MTTIPVDAVREPGVSVVICTHNGARRLPEVLSCLARQDAGRDDPFEVIVVDNASEEDIGAAARSNWLERPAVPLRTVREPRLGLNHARVRGLLEARADLVSFVDDDNLVASDWVRRVREIMMSLPAVGACGGFNEASPEISPPPWFGAFQSVYAAGPQGSAPGDVTESRGHLWGAGLTVRKSAWEGLVQRGFRSVLSDRRGEALSAGGDTELCLALRLSGWRLWYEPRLRLRHRLSADRLRWSYVRRLCRGDGRSSVALDAYNFAIRGASPLLRDRLARCWVWRCLACCRNLLRQPIRLLVAAFLPFEGDRGILAIEWHWGRLQGLIRSRSSYRQRILTVEAAPWRHSSAV